MADKDLDELISQLGKSARATDSLASAQRTATQAADRLAAAIADLNKQASRGATDLSAITKSLNDHAAATRAAALAQAEIAKVQAPASSALKTTEAAAKASADQLKASRDAAKELSGVLIDTFAKIASGEDPLKTLAAKTADVSKVLVKAKIDGADLGGVLGQLGGSAGSLAASLLTIAGAQAAQTLVSKIAAASAGEAASANVSLAAASGGAAGALHLQAAAATEAAAKNVIAAETAVVATAATTEAAVASRGLGAALLGAVGGPIGLVVGALIAGVAALAFAQRDAAQSSTAAAGASDISAKAISDLNNILSQDPTPGVTVNVKEYTKAQLDRAKATYEVARADLMAKKAGAEARLADLQDGVVTEKTGPRGTYRDRRLSTAGGRAGSELNREKGAAQAAIDAANGGIANLDVGYERASKAIVAHGKELQKAQAATIVHTQAVKGHTAALSAEDEAWSRGAQSSKDFADALSEEIATMGLSNEEIRRRQINLEILKAPTSQLHDRLVELRDQWEQQTAVTRGAEEAQRAVAAQQRETLHTMREIIGDGPHFSTIFEDVAEALAKNVAQADATRISIEGIATALNKNDWTGALGSMVGLLGQLEKAFGKTGTAADKFTALAGVAQGVGGIVGGRTGSAISGAASGALGGMSLVASLAAAGTIIPGIGNVAGAAIGAVLGGIGSLFGSSKAKKQAKAQAAAEEAQRQAQIAAQGYDLDIQIAEASGDTATAKRLRRQQTLNGIAPANQARQQQLFDIEDAKQREADIKSVNEALASLGMVFSTVGDATDAARERLVKLSGGLEELTAQTAFFAEHFLSEDERLKPVKESVTGELARLKLPTDLTRDGFAKTVLGLDVSTEAGAELYAAMMKLAPAFDKVATAAETTKAAVDDKAKSIQDRIDDLVMKPADKLAKSRAAEEEAVKALDASLLPLLKTLWAVEDAATVAAEAAEKEAKDKALARDRSNALADLWDAQGYTDLAKNMRRDLALAEVEDDVQKDYMRRTWAAQDAAEKVSAARDVLTQAYEREQEAIQATKDKFKELSASLRTFSGSLTDTIAGTDPGARYRRTRETFLSTAAMARLGDPDAMGRLQSEGEAFTAASRDYVSTSLDYLRDVGLVRNAVDEAADTADRQVSIAQRQLDALDASVQGLIQINASVVSVEQAIFSLRGALAAARSAGVVSVDGSNLGLGNPAPPTTGSGAGGSAVDLTKTLDGKYNYDAMLGQMAYTESLRDPAFYAEHNIPFEVMIPGTQAYSLLQTFKVRNKDQYDYLEYQRLIQGYATGGSFEVGGSGPPDSKFFGLALSPGEAVNVQRADQKGDRALIQELQRLRAELAELRATSARIATSNDKMERTLTNVTEGGRAMQTQAAA
ncbi:hypothetical protein [Caulobacter sp.]|uniref:hypothetical protein n=1 Tax=Caulobacter sp. TaxID=78 RepID=UPI001B169F31|nr:hypothetical protein [Caulobacter sp.]MBO9544378.1 hypothetical protein [Caulobacter sp.]